MLHYKGRLTTTMTACSLTLLFIRQFSIPVPCPYSETSRPTISATQSSIQCLSEVLFLGLKLPGRDAYH